MRTVTHEELETQIRKYYDVKVPFFVYGAYGIGKSETVRKKAKEIADEKNREYKEWNDLTKEEKQEVIDNPEKYFVLIDTRLAQLDPSDLKGIPNIENNGAVEWKPPLFIYYMSKQKADGMAFFDESNLAPPSVQSAFYQIVHDRECGSYSLSGNFGMVSAGNRLQDKSNVYDMSDALKDRYGEVELAVPRVSEKGEQDWTDWAMENGINTRIISFIQFKPGLLFKKREDTDDKSTTPRGWERASNLIEDIDSDKYDLIESLVSSAVGEATGIQFKEWLERRKDINIREIMENPREAEIPSEKEDTGALYSIVSGVAERYKQNKSQERLEKVLIISDRVKPEFGILLLRMVKRGDTEYFKDTVKKTDEWSDLSKDYKKYLL